MEKEFKEVAHECCDGGEALRKANGPRRVADVAFLHYRDGTICAKMKVAAYAAPTGFEWISVTFCPFCGVKLTDD